MQVTVTSNLREKLERTSDPLKRKALKAAIYMEMEKRLEGLLGKAALDMPSTTVWVGKGVQVVYGRHGYRRDARKTRRNSSAW
jgi:hypothetical protein